LREAHSVNIIQSNKGCCETVKERLMEDRAYQLVKCFLPNANLGTRRRVIAELLKRDKTIGLIEWWTRGSIARKPWREFYVIVIQNLASE
jgi:hypothetical protein